MQRILSNRFMTIYISEIPNPKHVDQTRPVLIMAFIKNQHKFKVFKITHRSPQHKSKKIGRFYYPIKEWQLANLNKPSWVDTYKAANVPMQKITNERPIGKLTSLDSYGLFRFLINNRKLSI